MSGFADNKSCQVSHAGELRGLNTIRHFEVPEEVTGTDQELRHQKMTSNVLMSGYVVLCHVICLLNLNT
jgi:hypothetical protein